MNYQILKIKLAQIIECVDYYTGEPSINILLRNGRDALYYDDIDLIKFTIEELIEWYKNNINNIVSNQYVDNKDVHRKNKEVLNELLSYIESEKIAPPKSRYISINNESSLDSLMRLISKFHLVVKQLRHRYNSRQTLDISDEYDVQDLLHSLLYLYFDDIRSEEWTPSYAGKCSRQDFLLKKENIVIEVKKTRNGLSEKEIGDQLIIDIARYKSHPECKILVCFVYDPEERILNPVGIENDLTKEQNGLKVIVKIIQK